ncbi:MULTISPECIES: GGDEF domain-containing protein [Vibrio]|uniref:GGDEF domain-containing protein n=1 Tax=Vibrio proteolyticus NBRC 13287 TaxID=1219065 RepID=U3BGC3_VIBPR|nr:MULTISPECIES: GGDEF domain-containing protein [Vibrio]NAX20533.1 diguanylate cyclase [Vibrio sp. V39_P1S14PM300]GAD68729.1 hypothetical protein VPR01S_19_00110 [Vibrio proteolyticus NBRC 13287]
MKRSLRKKLYFQFSCTFLLCAAIVLLIWSQVSQYNQLHSQIEQVALAQRQLELVRTLLWQKQYLSEGVSAEDRLNAGLANFELIAAKIEDKQSSNDTMLKLVSRLNELLQQEQRLNNARNLMQTREFDSAQDLLFARYNMVLQNITDQLLGTQRQLLVDTEQRNTGMMYLVAAVLSAFALVLIITAFFILNRFTHGRRAIARCIRELQSGNYQYQVGVDTLDKEFVLLADFLHKLGHTLNQTTISRNELSREVAMQTAAIIKQKNELLHLSLHDPLTGLFNRRALEHHLNAAIERAQSRDSDVALIYFDLDGFKQVNDRHGHAAGDALLCTIAKRLLNSVRDHDIVARMGGDEFIICCELVGQESVPALLDRVVMLIRKLSEPISFEHQTLSVGVSIGISYYPSQSDNASKLIQLADKAMYVAKSVPGSAYYHDHLTTPIVVR